MIKTKQDKALEVAAIVHRLQLRKGNKLPYIIHPVSVMLIASTVTQDEDTLCACLLHDVLEDGDPKDYDEKDMLRDFGPEVTDIVKLVSKSPDGTWRGRNDAYLATLSKSNNQAAYIVCAADKIHNLTACLIDFEQVGDELWSRFNAGKDQQQWWYRSALELLQEKIPDSPLIAELSKLVVQLEAL